MPRTYWSFSLLFVEHIVSENDGKCKRFFKILSKWGQEGGKGRGMRESGDTY